MQIKQQLLILIIAFLLAFSNFLNGQNSQVVFKHLTQKDGLSESTVHTCYKDKNGFMWFGTDGGLDKFDGYEFTNYAHHPGDTSSITANFVVSILEDSYGGFWVATGYHGLNKFNPETEKFTHYRFDPNNPKSLSSNNIRFLFEDSNKNFWIATSGGGLSKYNHETNDFYVIKHNSNIENTIPSNYISSIAEDNYGNLWMGSNEGVLIKFNLTDSVFSHYKIHEDFETDLFNTNSGRVYIDRNENVWFCTSVGLFRLNPKTDEIQHFKVGDDEKSLSSNSITSIFEYEFNKFFITTDHGGLNILDNTTGNIQKLKHNKYDPTSPSNNQLYSIYKSDDEIIWICGFRAGVNYFDKNAIKFNQLEYLLEGEDQQNCCGSVTALTKDADNNLWIAYDGKGIEVFNKNMGIINRINTQSTPNSLNSDITTALYTDSENNIWIGTYLDGLYFYNWKSKSITHFKNNEQDSRIIPGNNVWNILEKDKDHLWIGTMGEGLGLFNKNGYLVKQYWVNDDDSTSISNTDVFIIKKDAQGDFWMGTRNGLNKYNKDTDNFRRYMSNSNDPNSLFGLWVYDIYEDSEKNLWIATDAGLNKYVKRTDNFINFASSPGMAGVKIFNILEDNEANLWLTTSKGISKFNIRSQNFRHYDISDGLQSLEFNYTTGLKDEDGSLYFGGTNGFNIFNPSKIEDNSLTPNVFITELSILNKKVVPGDETGVLKKQINFTERIILNHKQNVFRLKFAALNYTNTQKNQYKYKLEGFDQKWIYAGNKREVSYTNLNPGKYVFRVLGSNNDGLWNDEATILHIEIKPPFWKKKLFIALEVVLLLFIAALFIYMRIRRLRDEKIELTKKVKERTSQIEDQKLELEKHRNHLEQLIQERTSELVKAKEKAEESDRLKSAFLANMSHEIRTPMNAIVGCSKLLLTPDITSDEKNQFLRLINSNSDSLLRLIEDILDFSLIESDQLVLNKSNVNISEFVDNVYSSISLNYAGPDFEIIKTNKLDKRNTAIYTDKFRLSQILMNLMGNACKFTQKGEVEISVEIVAKHLVFKVRDTGIGIPEEEQKRIFERFHRHEDKYIKYRGVGLGLAISKQLSTLLGGELSLESEVNKGSVFTLTFPINELLTQDETKYEEILINVNRNWKGKKILIVEDEEANYIYLSKIIKATKADVYWAKDGEQAIAFYRTNNEIDAVLMDIRMPNMDGFEALKGIRSINQNQIVIAQTAYARPEDILRIENAGFNGYVSKPIDINEVLNLVEKHID